MRLVFGSTVIPSALPPGPTVSIAAPVAASRRATPALVFEYRRPPGPLVKPHPALDGTLVESCTVVPLTKCCWVAEKRRSGLPLNEQLSTHTSPLGANATPPKNSGPVP